MSRSSTRERGQTEPVAALVAVVALALAVGAYAGYAAGLPAAGSERDVTTATLESVRDAVGPDGAYDPDGEEPIDDLVRDALPDGYDVVVTVTTAGEAGPRTVAAVHVRSDGRPGSGEPPDSAQTASRPIAVVHGDGDVRGGRLEVTAWR